MNKPVVKRFKISGINSFDLCIQKSENVHTSFGGDIEELHRHDECEIYINLSGDVSFVVEDKIYPITTGSVIITKPNEYHHCILNKASKHKHICIFFSVSKNEKFFEMFFDREKGEKNLIQLSYEQVEEVDRKCSAFFNDDLSDLEKIHFFLNIIDMLKETPKSSIEEYPKNQAVLLAISFINRYYSEKINVSDIAKAANVSVNTLERHFKAFLGTTPYNYLKNRRLIKAQELLQKGMSVSAVCSKCGFPDYSHFISLFKQRFGITPYKYKK